VIRQFGTLHLILLLLFSFARDPLFHRHDGHGHESDEAGHEHLSLSFHTHLDLPATSARHDEQPEVGLPKSYSKAQPFTLFQVKPETSPTLPMLVGEAVCVRPTPVLIFGIGEPLPRTHDPPSIQSSNPRSPPV
jgi:hypothetical protein